MVGKMGGFGLVWFGLVWFGLVWFGYHQPFSQIPSTDSH
jgi:hypothetical protein